MGGRPLAIDASGISVSDRGGYGDARYGSKPKPYKLHAMIDVEDMRSVDFGLTSGHVVDDSIVESCNRIMNIALYITSLL